jgi:hypothetical protein
VLQPFDRAERGFPRGNKQDRRQVVAGAPVESDVSLPQRREYVAQELVHESLLPGGHYEANAQAAPDAISKRLRSAHQGSTCENPGSVEIGRSPLDSRAAAAIAGSGVRMGGTAW